MDTETNKKSCFAYINDNTCGALIKKDCKDCNFYRNRKDEKDPATNYLIEKTKEEIREKENK